RLGGAGLPPVRPPTPLRARAALLMLGGGLLAMTLLALRTGTFVPGQETVGRTFDVLLPLTSVIALAGLFVWGTDSPQERRRLLVVSILFAAAAVFWGCFEQAGST